MFTPNASVEDVTMLSSIISELHDILSGNKELFVGANGLGDPNATRSMTAYDLLNSVPDYMSTVGEDGIVERADVLVNMDEKVTVWIDALNQRIYAKLTGDKGQGASAKYDVDALGLLKAITESNDTFTLTPEMF